MADQDKSPDTPGTGSAKGPSAAGEKSGSPTSGSAGADDDARTTGETTGSRPASRGPRHALPEDMEPATERDEPASESGSSSAAGAAQAQTAGSRPEASTAPQKPAPAATVPVTPAYEDYEAPESNLMPKIIAAIVGGVLAVLLIGLLRSRGDD